jgi:Ca2+-binding RTX toxin-like protein
MPTITGTNGNDTLVGTSGNDTLIGLSGDDSLSVTFGSNSLDGGDGNDTLVGGSGNDREDGGNGNDTLYGGAGNDTLIGWYGTDTFYGGAGDDTIVGGTELSYTGNPSDTDYAVYSGNYADYDIHRLPTASYESPRVTVANATDGNDSLTGIEYLVFKDKTIKVSDIPLDHVSLVGTAGNDTLFGGAGDDTLIGLGGDDTLYSGGGNDVLSGGDGNDTIYANGSGASIDAGAGDDYVAIGNSDSTVYTHQQINLASFTGGAGTDTLRFVAPVDFIGSVFSAAASGFEIISFSNTYSVNVSGDAGNNTLDFSGFAIDPYSAALWADGGDGNDTITGTAGNDTLLGGYGDDTLNGGGGNDTIYGDSSYNSYGNDVMNGGDGNDTLYLIGPQTPGNAPSGSTMNGGNGDDTLSLGANSAIKASALIGGAGNDTLVLSYNITILGTAFSAASTGIENLTINNQYWSFFPTVIGDTGNNSLDFSGFTLTYNDHGISVDGADGNDTLTGTTLGDILTGSSGDDSLYGIGGNDTLYGGSGNDTLKGGIGDDLLDGGTDTDTAGFSGNMADYAIGKNLNGNWTISNAADGRDTMLNIEYVQFADKTVAVSSLVATAPVGTAGNDTLVGVTGHDTIYGLGGDDVLKVTTGNNLLDGGDGNDTLYGGAGNDTLYGGIGNDVLYGGTGTQTLNGGDGNDRIEASTTGTYYIYGGAGNDYIVVANNSLDGAGTFMTVDCGDGDDQFYLTSTYRSYSIAASALNGGAGTDLLAFGYATTLTGSSFSAASSGFEQLSVSGNNTLYGDDNANNFDFSGFTLVSDWLIFYAQGGDDTITGTSGRDQIVGGEGNNKIYGGAGDDVLMCGSGNDFISGGAGNDSIYGGTGDDTMMGDAGNDSIDGAGGTDTVRYAGNYADYSLNIITGSRVTVSSAADGSDTLDNVEYLQFADRTILTSSIVATGITVTGTSGYDTLAGTAGNDTIYGLGGGDWIYGYAGNDSLYGGDGSDYIAGGDGNDYISGGDGDDSIDDQIGNNTIDGGAGNDSIVGGATTTSAGGAGDDRIYGGTALYYYNAAQYLVMKNEDGTISVSSSQEGADTLTNVTTIQFADKTIQASTVGYVDQTITGTAGDDSLNGGGGNDTIHGMGGNDSLKGGGGNDILYGDDGNDTIFDSAGVNTIYGGNGNDTVWGDGGNGVIHGDAGDDYLHATTDGTVTIYGDDGNDQIATSYSSNMSAAHFSIYGGNGNDSILASYGQYTIIDGGDGDDYITLQGATIALDAIHGGAGNDTLTFGYAPTVAGATFSAETSDFENIAFDGSTLRTDSQSHRFDFSGFVIASTYGVSLTCQGADNYIIGTAHNDKLYGGAGNNTFYGGAGDDTLATGGASSQMYGGSGNDTFIVVGGSNILVLDGGDGNDIFNVGNNTSDVWLSSSALKGGAGTDRLYVSAALGMTGASFSAESSGIEELQNDMGILLDDSANNFDFSGFAMVGSNGLILLGGGGNDTLTGTYLDDLISGDAGNDIIDGGGGIDIAGYSGLRASYTVTLNANGSVTVAGPEGTDTLWNIEGISFSDVTLVVPDAFAPVLKSASPAQGSTGVAVDANIVLKFNDSVQAGSGSIVITKQSDGSVVAVIPVSDTGQIAFRGNTVTINPAFVLAPDTTYCVTMAAGVIQDLYGNPFAGISSTSTVSFDTIPYGVLTQGTAGNDTLTGSGAIDILVGGDGNDVLSSGDEHDSLIGGAGDDILDGGSNVDVAVFSGKSTNYSIVQMTDGSWQVHGADGNDTLRNIEYAKFDDQTIRLLPGSGTAIAWNSDPASYMAGIRDFDGNNLGAVSSWKLIGAADVNGDGVVEHILVNRDNGRWAEVATEADGRTYFANNGWAGDTRVVGIYIDPLVALGIVQQGSDYDSQRRFQNDLNIGNINKVLGSGDYDHDGLQEVYFSLTDGTAYLHAYMHADGNIQYANYQNQQQVIDYLTQNGFGASTYAGWFTAAS